MPSRTFPSDVFAVTEFPAPAGDLLQRVRGLCMFPPYPWGQWAYGNLLGGRCAYLHGDVLEAGVGMGGMSLYLALMTERLGQDRRVFSVDSFEGLPEPDTSKDNQYFAAGLYGPGTPQGDPLSHHFAGSEDAALEAFRMRITEFDVEDRVIPIKGQFEDALSQLDRDQSLCFVHIDGDLFESVYCALEHLYDRVVDGGVIAIDDFFHPGQGPLRAALEFFNERCLTPLYQVSFPYSVFLFKEDWGHPPRAVDGNAYSLQSLRDDPVFTRALEMSSERSQGVPRALDNCRLLLEVVRSKPYTGEIYDYWRSLEQFWESIDTRPEDWET